VINKTFRFGRALWQETAKRIPYILLVMLFLLLVQSYFNSKQAAETTKQTKQTSQTTAALIKSQQKILDAIKESTENNQQISEHQANIIICMLQVPVAQRTTDLQQQCRAEVEAGDKTSTVTPSQNSTPSASNSTPSNSITGNSTAAPASNPPSSDNPAPTPEPKPGPICRVLTFVTFNNIACE
jgi:hypothetical protein